MVSYSSKVNIFRMVYQEGNEYSSVENRYKFYYEDFRY